MTGPVATDASERPGRPPPTRPAHYAAKGARPSRTGLRVLIGLGIFAFLAAWALWAASNVITARHELLVGRSAAETARTQTTATDLEQARPVAALHQASTQFHEAQHHLDSPSLFLVRYLPVVGRQVQAARALSGAGAEAADVIAQALTSAHALLTVHPAAGSARLAQLRQALTIGDTAAQRLRSLHYGPRVGLLASLAQGHNQLARDVGQVVSSLDRGTAAGHSLVDLLSGDHRVLVLATNNAEMRAGSGMILQLGVLQVADGSIQLEPLKSVNDYPVPTGAVTPPPDLAARWGWLHPADDWDELLNSPHFDVTAPTAAQMWVAAGQPPVDAVMAIDPVFLADVVAVTGPVTVGSQTFTGNQIEPFLLHDQYATSTRTARLDQLGALAQAAFARFNAGGWSLPAMLQAIAGDARGRHVMVWSRSPAAEAGWVQSGAGGLLSRQSLMVSVHNRGRDKLDWFLASASTLSTVREGNHTKVTVAVHLTDTTPVGQADEVIGVQSGAELDLYPGQKLNPGDYVGIVSLTAPGGATGLAIDGVAEPPINGPEGPTNVVAAQYIIRRGTSVDVNFSFLLPGTGGSMVVEPEARIPATTWADGPTTWTGDHQKLVTW